MFTKSKVSQSMLDAVNSVLKNQPVVEEKKTPVMISEEKQVVEVAPPGFEGTVRAMKKHKDISNPFALAWSMKNKGYKSHKKADGSAKNEEVETVEEDVESIDEISKTSLHSYATAAHAKYDTLRNKSDAASTEKKSKLAKGIKTANMKMNPPVAHKPEPKVDMSSPSSYYKSKGSGYVGDSVEVSGTPLEEKSELKGNQDKIDANHNGKIDGQDFRILRAKKKVKEDVESVEEGWDDMVKDAKDKVKSGPKPNGGSGVKQGSRYGGSKQKEEPETQKEEVNSSEKTTDTLAGRVKGGKDNEHVAYKVKLKTEAKTLSPGQDDAPFDTQYSPSPMSRAKDLARSAMKRVKANLKDKK